MMDKVRNLRRGICILGLTLVLILLTTRTTTASQDFQSTLDGGTIFRDKCSRCHTIGGGDKKGPDLEGVTQQRDQQWLVDFISNPRQVIASGDSTANSLLSQFNNNVMPDVGLSQEQVLAVISYLDEQSGSATTAEGSTPVSACGNPDNGNALFINDVKLANGGLACISCHRIDNVGILGGGALGPDLTEASGIFFGEAGIADVLADIPFPTMQPIFADHPLTESERADLAAFITSQAGKPQVNKEVLILALSAAGFLAVMALGAFYWRGRLRLVRQRLVEQVQGGKRHSSRRAP
jgi:mono/diheme cytochrome c family protein